VVEKKSLVPAVETALNTFLEGYKAGSPTDPTVYWLLLKPKEVVRLFHAQTGVSLSISYIKVHLNRLGYRYRQQSKQLATASYAQRNEQFLIIFNLVAIMSLDSPIISIDCKKKEQLGQLYRAGKTYTTAAIKVLDHDYPYLSEGKVVPYGIYDIQTNEGYISIGSSAETAEFITDNLRWWWTEFGQKRYPKAKNILILCDAGGGNSYRHHCFKYHLQVLAKEWGLSLIIAHYPPYASKWNPIEHRLFCHAHQAIQGTLFTDYKTVKQLFENTATDTGLKVNVRLNLKIYNTGNKIDPQLIDKNRIQFNKQIPQLSYRIEA
jgi:Rhodopirellula transposase DDE domain